MTSLIRNLVLALGFALLFWVGYEIFLNDDSDLVEVKATSEAALQGQMFLTQIQEMRQITLKSDVLSDPVFESLVDLREDVLPEPVGRKNPFLKIPGL